jgi:lipoprotein-anchoring transpeptidase ErfK/SrfK
MKMMQARMFLAVFLAVALSHPAFAGRSAFALFWPKSAQEPYRGPQIVPFRSGESPGTIIIEASEHRLYLVQPAGKAIRYAVGVGRDGFAWSGTAHIAKRAEWPAWYPPKEMIDRAAAEHKFVPYSLEGGTFNPLGARALYLYEGTRDTLYRIHGTNEPRSIGRSVSSGCIRMLNDDVIDLYGRVSLGTKVIVR